MWTVSITNTLLAFRLIYRTVDIVRCCILQYGIQKVVELKYDGGTNGLKFI